MGHDAHDAITKGQRKHTVDELTAVKNLIANAFDTWKPGPQCKGKGLTKDNQFPEFLKALQSKIDDAPQTVDEAWETIKIKENQEDPDLKNCMTQKDLQKYYQKLAQEGVKK